MYTYIHRYADASGAQRGGFGGARGSQTRGGTSHTPNPTP